VPRSLCLASLAPARHPRFAPVLAYSLGSLGHFASLPTLASIPSLTPHPRSHDTKEGLAGLAGGFKTAQLQHQATTTRTTCCLPSASANRLCNQILGGLAIKADVQHPCSQAQNELRGCPCSPPCSPCRSAPAPYGGTGKQPTQAGAYAGGNPARSLSRSFVSRK